MAGGAEVAEDLEEGEEIEGGGELEVEILWITGYFMILEGGDRAPGGGGIKSGCGTKA